MSEDRPSADALYRAAEGLYGRDGAMMLGTFDNMLPAYQKQLVWVAREIDAAVLAETERWRAQIEAVEVACQSVGLRAVATESMERAQAAMQRAVGHYERGTVEWVAREIDAAVAPYIEALEAHAPNHPLLVPTPQSAPAETRAASERENPLRPALHALVSEISERCWAAGWMSGIEQDIERAVGQDAEYDYGQSEITTQEIAALRELRRLGVWFER